MGREACARQCKYFIGCQIYGYFQQRKVNGLCLHRPVYLAQTRFRIETGSWTAERKAEEDTVEWAGVKGLYPAAAARVIMCLEM